MIDDPRLQALLPLWNWLPAFRAIAETQHLPTAARLCGVGPSSLSRSLTLLERTVGRRLFDRAGRSLQLNAEGQVLLAAVRDAMRRVDDALQDLAGDDLRGLLRVGSTSAGTTAMIAAAFEQLRAEHTRLVPQLLTRTAAETCGDLLRGSLDVAFQETPARREGLVVEQVGSLSRSVYCGRRHPLFARDEVTDADIEAAQFVTPPADADQVAPDGWPVDRPRNVALVVDQLRVGLELCVEQPLLAVLPDALASPRAGELKRLTAIPIAASPVFAIRRKALGPRPSAAARLIELISGSRARATAPSSRR